MAKLDRLLNDARSISKSEFLSMCYLEKDETDSFVFRPTSWTGKLSGYRELGITIHSTRADALSRFDDLAEQYPGKTPPILLELVWGDE